MKLWTAASLTFFVLAVILWGACAPKTTPTAIPTATPIPAQPLIGEPTAKTLAPEEAAWAKVVEAAKKEGKVTDYSYNLVGDIGLAVAKAFKERYGITLELINGRGSEFTERVKTEKRMGRLVGDLHDGSSGFAENMKIEGLTMSLADDLPVFREQGIWKADVFSGDVKDKHIIGFSVGYYSPWINTKLITDDKVPQVWRDLLKPQWKGKMLLTDPRTSVASIQYLVSLMRGGAIDEDFLKALYGQDLRFTIVGSDDASTLARGERWLSIRGSPATYGRFIAEGAPLKAIDVKDGVVLTATPVIVAFAGGPHPNATRLFINWFLSKEGQEIWTKAASTSPIRNDVPDSSPMAARLTPQKPILQTTEDAKKGTEFFRDKWLEKLWGLR